MKYFTLTLALAAPLAHAELIDADWLVEGDQRAVYDTRTDVTWLDLRETLNQSYNEVHAQLNTEYAGFAFATEAQVEQLVQSYFLPSTHSGAFSGDTPPRYVDHGDAGLNYWLRQLFLREHEGSTYGFYTAPSGRTEAHPLALAGASYTDRTYLNYGQYQTSDRLGYIGHFLVQDGAINVASSANVNDVSAPLFGALLGLGVMGFVRRKPAAQ